MEEEVISILRRNGTAFITFASGRRITVPSAMLEELAVAKGTRADPEEITAQKDEKAPAFCLRQVLLWQSRRDHAAEEMKRRLVMMGYPAAAADAALEKLGECDVVSDRRYCESLVRRKKRGRGREALLMEMRARGVDADTAAAALEQELDAEEEARGAARLAADMLRRGRDRDRVYLALLRRGYSRSLSMKALDAALKVMPEGEEEEKFHRKEIFLQE